MEKKILVVEDEAALRGALVEALTLEGFTVVQAGNGEEGLRAAEAEHPDLILLDVLMPVMDGMTMLTTLRKQEWGKNMKVIVLTNDSATEKVADSVEDGAYDYLIKSDWKMSDVIVKVRSVLLRA